MNFFCSADEGIIVIWKRNEVHETSIEIEYSMLYGFVEKSVTVVIAKSWLWKLFDVV